MLTFFLIAISVLAGAVWIYNRLVKDRNQVANAWSDIDVQLVRRHALIPQLVNAVKAYAAYEKATFVAVTELRTQAAAIDAPAARGKIEGSLGERLRELILVAEDYPDLQADENFQQLQAALTDTEDHLQYARRFYNGSVRILNTRIESFPHLLIAQPLGFLQAEFFAADDEARDAPAVRLN